MGTQTSRAAPGSKPLPTERKPRTFTFDYARDGDMFGEDIVANSLGEAEQKAVEALNRSWGTSYADWDAMAEDSDGCTLGDLGDLMAERLPLDTVTLYRRLADGLSDMVEGDRLNRPMSVPDYEWLADLLEQIAIADPGDVELPSHMRGEG